MLQAYMADAGFESFTEDDNVLCGYIRKEDFLLSLLQDMLSRFELPPPAINEIEPENWNAVWESNFQPIDIPGKLLVRAQFHEPRPEYPMEIVIEPKMSFGTGHHATTWQVMNIMFKLDFAGRKVLDFGTGTGILAILAQKLGAKEVWAIDYDPQCIENSEENFSINGSEDIRLLEGDIRAVNSGGFDVIIGNITRNVILEFLPEIATRLAPSGFFIASGFYREDLPLINFPASELGLELITNTEKDKWCAALFQKRG
jgi:ribosomal protein L11 methyltransferase